MRWRREGSRNIDDNDNHHSVVVVRTVAVAD
jgi:hypothetical protein